MSVLDLKEVPIFSYHVGVAVSVSDYPADHVHCGHEGALEYA